MHATGNKIIEAWKLLEAATEGADTWVIKRVPGGWEFIPANIDENISGFVYTWYEEGKYRIHTPEEG